MSGPARRSAAVRSRHAGRAGDGGAAGWRFGPSPARAAALLAIVACVLAVYGLTTVPALAITRIDVSPLSWTDRDAVIQRLGVEPGINAFQLSTDQLAERIEAIPSVAGARVEVRLPDTLAVTVTEREPILAWQVGDATYLVDREGMLFALASSAPGTLATLPTIVDGRAGSRAVLAIGTKLDPTDLDAATRLASLKPADVGSQADGLTVRITDADGFIITTTPASWIAVFGPYSPVLRSPALIPGQVRLLRSMLFGQEARLLRIVLADETHGTVVPRPSGH